jgi:hypothetical protein
MVHSTTGCPRCRHDDRAQAGRSRWRHEEESEQGSDHGERASLHQHSRTSDRHRRQSSHHLTHTHALLPGCECHRRSAPRSVSRTVSPRASDLVDEGRNWKAYQTNQNVGLLISSCFVACFLCDSISFVRLIAFQARARSDQTQPRRSTRTGHRSSARAYVQPTGFTCRLAQAGAAVALVRPPSSPRHSSFLLVRRCPRVRRWGGDDAAATLHLTCDRQPSVERQRRSMTACASPSCLACERWLFEPLRPPA